MKKLKLYKRFHVSTFVPFASYDGVKSISCLVLLLCIYTILPAQSINDSIYIRLWKGYWKKYPQPVSAVTGLATTFQDLSFPRDSTSRVSLFLTPPETIYTKISHKQYRRTVNFYITQKDSVQISIPLEYSDTLSAESLQRIYKGSGWEFRGDNPNAWGKWVSPLILVSSGVVGISALFYVRSKAR